MNTLVSSLVYGPLGVLHLPRLWMKWSQWRIDILPGGVELLYPDVEARLDTMVLKGLGLTTDETFTFIQNRKPTYPQFEAWIKQNGGWQDEIALDTLNDKIRNFRHDDETRDYILRLVGLTDETCPLRDYIGLTQLEELAVFHRENSQETTLPDGRKLRPMAAPCPLAAPQQELRDGPDGQPPSGDQVLAAYAGNGD